MSPIQELRQCLQDAENNRQQEDPGQTDLKWDGFIEGIKHAIYRLQMTAPVTSPVLWGQMLRYHTDDHDISSAQLCIQQGGNGDWYISIADSPDHHPISGVRICTSGGAAALCPGLGIAIARAYQAMFDTQNRPQPSSMSHND